MKNRIFIICMIAAISLISTLALADSIKGRPGVTGRIGFTVPADSNIAGRNVETDAGFVYGGGFIYGVTDEIAAEMDITSSSFDSNSLVVPGLGRSDFTTVNVALGAQYRYLNLGIKQLVPYAGGGLDILLNDVNTGGAVKVDDTVGVHISGGADYFMTKDFIVTSELKGVFAPDADLLDASNRKIGDFDPNNFTMTVGVRYMFK